MSEAAPVLVAQEAITRFKRAEKLVEDGFDDDARPLYTSLLGVKEITSLVHFRLGEIWNREGRPETSCEYHIKAFEIDPNLSKRITTDDHLHHVYEYQPVEQMQVESCPLCGREGCSHWVFNMVTNQDFNPVFHPVRVWKMCTDCQHLYAAEIPIGLTTKLKFSENVQYRLPRIDLLPHMAQVMKGLKQRAPGVKMLDVGSGAGELLAVADEIGLETTGLDVRLAHARRIAKTFDTRVVCADFVTYATDEHYDIICMGDVLEHMLDPDTAVNKALSLLNPGGVLWISTPNFDSAFSRIQQDRDPMRRVCEHLNYFSYASLEMLLLRHGFEIVDYAVSRHYNGSMEVTAVKPAV